MKNMTLSTNKYITLFTNKYKNTSHDGLANMIKYIEFFTSKYENYIILFTSKYETYMSHLLANVKIISHLLEIYISYYKHAFHI